MAEQIEDVVLHEATEKRYLNYALSVITSRALPDVRDGLKPVQRRILYAMFHNLHLHPDARYRKSAAVVGEVMAKYHPHGDQSIYDAMVRMAQSFSLRAPLVDGQGNFGSLDGDNAAAMRYTEAKLRHLAEELLGELKKDTVDTRQNYDGTLDEPIVLPARFPNLLVNGAEGIAVGMATKVPPHNLREVVKALIALIDDPELTTQKLVSKYVRGPDFPTGGEILNSRAELVDIYETGQGAVNLRGTWDIEEQGRQRFVVIDAIPFAVVKSKLIEQIADHVRKGNVPQIIDVRDESTEDVRIVLELKKGANAEAAMAWLYKKTSLQTRFSVNLTALVPTDEPGVLRPDRLGLKAMLNHFLDFRYDVTRRRLSYDLRKLEERIHILRGFEILFDALDEAIALIRASEGKADARTKLMERFELDHAQAEAILETKLYKLAKMEIEAIREELREKEAAAAELRAILSDEGRMWDLIRSELDEIRDAYGENRRTKVVGPQDEVEFSEEVYIVAEDAFCIVTREGWFKRQKSYTDLDAIRVRDGDGVGWVMPASSRECLVLVTDRGRAYSLRVDDVPMTTGYGEPVQTRFDFDDGERVVGVFTTDTRTLPEIGEKALAAVQPGDPPPPYVFAVSRRGKCLRFSVEPHREPSNRNGRLIMRLEKSDDGVVYAAASNGAEIVSLASRSGRCLLFRVDDVKVLAGPGKGVTAIKLMKTDHVLGAKLVTHRMDGVTVTTNRGREETVRSNKFSIVARGNPGREIIRSGYIASVLFEPTELAFRTDEEDDDEASDDESTDASADATDTTPGTFDASGPIVTDAGDDDPENQGSLF